MMPLSVSSACSLHLEALHLVVGAPHGQGPHVQNGLCLIQCEGVAQKCLLPQSPSEP